MSSSSTSNPNDLIVTDSPQPSSMRRQRYDASHAMDRLRATFIADYQEHIHDAIPSSTANMSSESLYELADDQTVNKAANASQNGQQQQQREKSKKHARKASATNTASHPSSSSQSSWIASLSAALGQVPAVALIAVFHLMIGIPFGVSYFPIGWRSESSVLLVSTDDDTTTEGAPDAFVHGAFPLPGKEALGIRMFLYSTIVAQLVFTWKSSFKSPIGLQMVENVPFYHEFAAICIRHCGYGLPALVNLLFMFGLSTILVGIVFYLLGRCELGRIVYFFPTHVLVGCIGGIGFYLCKTGLEVTMDASFSMEHLWEDWHLLRVTLFFEVLLRIFERATLDAEGKPRYSLLSPIYFCMITPMFYFGLFVLQVPIQGARDDGYFFPTIESSVDHLSSAYDGSWPVWQMIMEDKGMLDMWRILDVRVLSWGAMTEALPTIVALTLFSLIHVPINIPSLGISTKQDVEMDNELVAHGYSNLIAGICGCGLQNYLAYTQSVVYDRSGGRGKRSGIAVASVTAVLFVIGPTMVVPHIPRCMAGALLLHVGLDLFFEGVYDTIGKFDTLEYSGIWLIVIVMTLYGMEAAMVAGVIAAVSTYAMQSITYLNPLRGSMSAETLRSSYRSRNQRATAVIDDPVNGRSRIIVVQLQGHLFFGNLAQLNSGIDNLLATRHRSEEGDSNGKESVRRIVILDFSLVVSIDSSAAQGLIKLKTNMIKKYAADVCIFVTGSEDGFPCEFDLSNELTSSTRRRRNRHLPYNNKNSNEGSKTKKLDSVTECTTLLHASTSESESNVDEEHQELMDLTGSFVVESLDLALIFAENVLIGWEDPSLLVEYDPRASVADHFKPIWGDQSARRSSLITDEMLHSSHRSNLFLSEDEEKEMALQYLMNMVLDRNASERDIHTLLSRFRRETYAKDEFVWKQNDASDSTKILVSGKLVAMLENEAGTMEVVFSGNIIGELGLIQGIPRMSSVRCISEEGAVLYSLSRQSYEDLIQTAPYAARHIDMICISYLASRVQHVSNRIFETRCLPI